MTIASYSDHNTAGDAHSRDIAPAVVLLIEDDTGQSSALQRLLHSRGYLCVRSIDADEALAELSARHVDIIVADLGIAERTDANLTQRIRALSHHKKTPIIGVSGKPPAAGRAQALSMGMDDFIPKPFDTSRLVTAIKQWIDKKTP